MDKTLRIIGQVGAILLLGVFSIWVTSFFTNKFSNGKSSAEIVKETISEVIIKRPVCPSTTDEYNNLRKTGQTVIIAKDFNSYAANSEFVKTKIVTVETNGTGSQVACGYLFVRAHTNNGQLQQEWEHPYIKPGQFGGHMLTNNAITNNVVRGKTELLYNLANIKYHEKLNLQEIREADWVALLNVTNYIQFNIAFNTTNITGILDEISITYKCWNPETGKETNDCHLSAI